MSIYTDDTAKSLKFLVGEHDITSSVLSGSFSLENILCAEQLNFGECNAARVQFTTLTDLDLTRKTVEVKFGAGDTWENVGQYKVSYSSTQVNSTQIKCTAYDAMKEFDVDISSWYESLTFPMTLKSFRDSLCEYIGVTQETVSLVNDSMPVYKTVSPSKLNGMDMMFYIGQINAVFPHATPTGTITWYSLGTDVKHINTTMVQGETGFEAKSYTISPISKLIIREEDGDIGVTAGNGANAFVIKNNILVYGFNTEQLTPIATAIYNKIQGITYTPASVTMKHIPTWRMGELVAYGTTTFYILSRKTSGLLYDEIQAGGNEYLEEDTGIESTLQQLRGKSNVLTRDLEKTQLAIEDVEAGFNSKITQLSNSVEVQIEYIQDQIDGNQEIIYTEDHPTLENYPAWDWCATPVFGETEFDENGEIPWTYTDESYHEHMRTLVYDETESVTYRFIKHQDQWIFDVLANSEFAVILSEITKLQVADNQIQASVQGVELSLENNYFTKSDTQSLITQTRNSIELLVSGTYVTQGSLSSGYYSKAETNSLISQTSSSITASVSGTYATKTSLSSTQASLSASLQLKLNTTDLVSELNASADVINLKSNRLTISSTHFKLTSNGTCTMTNANVTGTFEMTGGSIELKTTQRYESALDLTFWNNCKYGITSEGIYAKWDGYGRYVVLDGTGLCFYNKITSGKTRYDKTWVTDDHIWTEDLTVYGETRLKAAPIITSDREEKKYVYKLPDKIADFIYSLRPVKYKYKKGTSNRYHHGLIAQEVKEAMGDDDWGVYIDPAVSPKKRKQVNEDGNIIEEVVDTTKGLRYEEIIADLIVTVQTQNKRIKKLEEMIHG